MSLTLLFSLNFTAAAAAANAPDYQNVDYVPGAVASNGEQEFDIYLPDTAIHAKPASGWPVVVWVNLTDYTTTSISGVASGPRLGLIERGIAVVDAMVSISGNGGLFTNPAAAEWATDDVPEKDLIWIVQKIRDIATPIGLDASSITLYGPDWASGTLCAWVGMEAEHADAGGSTTQEQMSSIPTAVFTDDAMWWNPAYISTHAQDHLRKSGDRTNPAADMSEAVTSDRLRSSPIYRGFLDRAGGSASVRFYTGVGLATQFAALNVDSDTLPLRANDQATDVDGWQAHMGMRWLRRHHGASNVYHSNRSVLVTTTANQFHLADRFFTVAQNQDYFIHAIKSVSGYGGIDSFNVRIGWSKSFSTSRKGVSTKHPVSARRQIQKSSSSERLTASVRSWRVGSEDATQADITRLRAIADASARGALPIDFDLPNGIGMVLALPIARSLAYTQTGYDRYSFSLDLKEAI